VSDRMHDASTEGAAGWITWFIEIIEKFRRQSSGNPCPRAQARKAPEKT